MITRSAGNRCHLSSAPLDFQFVCLLSATSIYTETLSERQHDDGCSSDTGHHSKSARAAPESSPVPHSIFILRMRLTYMFDFGEHWRLDHLALNLSETLPVPAVLCNRRFQTLAVEAARVAVWQISAQARHCYWQAYQASAAIGKVMTVNASASSPAANRFPRR